MEPINVMHAQEMVLKRVLNVKVKVPLVSLNGLKQVNDAFKYIP